MTNGNVNIVAISLPMPLLVRLKMNKSTPIKPTNRKELLTLLYHKLPTYTEIAESNRPILQKWLRDFNEFVEKELKYYE